MLSQEYIHTHIYKSSSSLIPLTAGSFYSNFDKKTKARNQPPGKVPALLQEGERKNGVGPYFYSGSQRLTSRGHSGKRPTNIVVDGVSVLSVGWHQTYTRLGTVPPKRRPAAPLTEYILLKQQSCSLTDAWCAAINGPGLSITSVLCFKRIGVRKSGVTSSTPRIFQTSESWLPL